MRPEPRWSRLLRLALAFALMVAAIEAMVAAARWWREGAEALDALDWLLIAVLPVLAALWLWKFSVLAPGRGQCLLPEEERRQPRA